MTAPAQDVTTISTDQNSGSHDEAARVAAVERYRLATGSADRIFTQVAALAAEIVGASMAAVSLVDGERNWFLGVHGFDAGRDVPRDEGLCGPVIDGDIPALAPDVQADPSVRANRFVRAYGLGFYSCTPFVDADGHPLGTVAVMDSAPRRPTVDQLRLLDHVARVVMEQLDVRLATSGELRTERRQRDAAEFGWEDARRDLNRAEDARDAARRDRDDARSGRREAEEGRYDARRDRDTALRDRDVAEHERDIVEEYATVLQRTLLPPMLPRIEGLSIAAHYHPASSRHVGGDFYDIFALGGDRWAFFIGDVEGHGVEAAVATSLIRYTLRSAALHHRNLTDALVELNEVLLRELRPHRFCTVILGTIERAADDIGGWQVEIATGGHLPALLVDPATASATPVRPSGGALVGALSAASFESCGVRLLPGQSLLTYTDGLVEARRGDDPFDEDRLAAFVAERAALNAERLVGDLATLAPKLDPTDDVALLAITAG